VITVSGEVTYLPRIALPSDAVVHLWLEDASADRSEARFAEHRVPTTGRQVPIPFDLRISRQTQSMPSVDIASMLKSDRKRESSSGTRIPPSRYHAGCSYRRHRDSAPAAGRRGCRGRTAGRLSQPGNPIGRHRALAPSVGRWYVDHIAEWVRRTVVPIGFRTLLMERGTDMAKRTIVVVGATGSQGGGLARAILNDPDGEFACRAVTRNPDSDAARALADAGADVVRADLDDLDSIQPCVRRRVRSLLRDQLLGDLLAGQRNTAGLSHGHGSKRCRTGARRLVDAGGFARLGAAGRRPSSNADGPAQGASLRGQGRGGSLLRGSPHDVHDGVLLLGQHDLISGPGRERWTTAHTPS
jgi:hypothetical protein